MTRDTRLASATESYQADLEPVTAHVVAQYHAANGGSSFKAWGGERATAGYSVGGMGGVPEKVIGSANLSPVQFQQHRKRVRAALRDAPVVEKTSAVAGTWRRQADNVTVTDASNNTEDREQARAWQTERNEDAVWNLAENREEDLR